MKKIILYIIAIVLCFYKPAICAVYEASYIPWSGYWWPKIHGGLVTGWDYNGHPSPFEKYDYVTVGTYEGPATEFGREHHYATDALLWEGLCFCWSAAAILEEEPIHKGVYKDTLFLIGDKKGLLTAAYLGTTYNTYSTEKPVDFHQILENFIANQKIPVIMDLGTGGESWNYPVFKYEINYTQDGNTRHYTTTVYFATDEVDPDFVGTHISRRTFYYYFILDQDGNIIENEWEKESFAPVNAYEPFGTKVMNTALNLDTVREIAYTYDDSYEENDDFLSAASLSNGSHTLVAMDKDCFQIDLRKNNRVTIQVIPEWKDSVWLRTYTPDGELIQETLGSSEQQVIAGDDYPTGICFFEIEPVKYSRDPYYTLIFKHNLSYQGIFPVYPPGQWRSGIAFLSPDKNPFTNIRTIFSLINQDGSPQISFIDNSPDIYLLGMADEDFGLPMLTGSEYIRIDSDKQFSSLQASTAEKYDLMLGANFIPLEKSSSKIFFPYFARTGGWKTEIGIINTGEETEEILLYSYDKEGNILASDTLEFAPGQKWEKDSSVFGIMLSGAESVSAETVSGRNSLTGYIIYSYSSKGKAIVTLKKETGTEMILPHIASDGYWWTEIAFMNIGEEDSNINCFAYDIQGNLIGTAEYVLKPKQNFVREAANIFSDVSAKDIVSMRIVSQNNQELYGLLLYGTDKNLQMAGLQIHPSYSSQFYLPHVPCIETWWTGIGIMNTGDTEADISFTLFKENGNILGIKTAHLNPNQRWAGFVTDLFEKDTAISGKYMEIKSANGEPISGVYVIGTSDGKRLMGDGF